MGLYSKPGPHQWVIWGVGGGREGVRTFKLIAHPHALEKCFGTFYLTFSPHFTKRSKFAVFQVFLVQKSSPNKILGSIAGPHINIMANRYCVPYSLQMYQWRRAHKLTAPILVHLILQHKFLAAHLQQKSLLVTIRVFITSLAWSPIQSLDICTTNIGPSCISAPDFHSVHPSLCIEDQFLCTMFRLRRHKTTFELSSFFDISEAHFTVDIHHSGF